MGINNIFIERIRELRENYGLSQKEIAHKLSINCFSANVGITALTQEEADLIAKCRKLDKQGKQAVEYKVGIQNAAAR
ncbi:MAG: helix-turn-helix domain-containing protein [Eubacteriaceae bacterium]|nr:helix-turn-helix domain-containing protein [Eubacteriaceae bacterium]